MIGDMEGLILLAALSGAPQPAVPAASPAVAQAQLCVYDGRSGAASTIEEALARARAADVVYAGEQHTDARHHRAQAALIAGLGASAGFEMATSPSQAALDRYLAGGPEADFLADVWKKDWGFSFDLYRPVFDALRGGTRSGIALNVPRAIVEKVDKQGWAALTPAERALVPADFRTVTDPEYVGMLREWYAAHGRDLGDAAAVARFVDAMSLWNEGMAARLAALAPGAPKPVVVLAGAFHVHDAGMPASVARRAPALRQVSIQLETGASCPASLPAADLILGSDYVFILRP